jgi:signal transduction histidine kinase
LYQALQRRLATLTGVLAFAAVAPDGWFVATSGSAAPDPHNISERPLYRALVGPPISRHPYLDVPRLGRTGAVVGRPMLNLGRAIVRPDGTLAGIVVGGLSIDYLDLLFKQFQIGAGGIVQLYREDGILVAQSSGLTSDFGRSFADTPAFRTFEAETPEPAILAGPDGVERLYSSRCLEDLGLVVVVGRAEADIEAQWLRTQATPLILLIAALIGAVPLGILALRAESRRRDAKAATLERLARMASASTEIASAGTAGELLERATRLSRALIGARRAVACLDRDGAAPLRHDDGTTAEPAAAPTSPDVLLAVPLVARDGAALGSIQLSEPDRGAFDAADEAVLVQIAQVASAALERLISLEQLAIAAAAAERTRDEIERVLTSTSDGVYTLDHQDRFNFINPQARSMLRLDEPPIGTLLWDIFPDLRHSELHREYERVRAERTPRRFDIEHWGLCFSISAFPLGDGLSVFFRDVTDQRKVEEQLRQAQKMEAVGQLTGGIAHDFNNLLTVMLGNAALLSTHPEAGPTARRLAATIRVAAQKGAELTSHLLAFARQQPLRPSAIDVADRVRELVPLLLRTLSPSIAVQLGVPDAPVTALVDANQLDAAMLNLAINASDAMPEGGDLLIEAGVADLAREADARALGLDPGRYARLAISDTGSGIPREILPRIFDPFFTTKPPGKGTGLGLSMVYGFARQSGGTVVARSEPGKGSTITLYLPLAASPPAGTADGIVPAVLRGAGQTILVVEGAPLVRDHAGLASAALGYAPTVADTAEAALALLRGGHRFDLLFIDAALPAPRGGPALAAAAAALQPDIRILYASGRPGDGAGLRETGPLLTKPYDVEALGRALAAALAGSSGETGRDTPH